MPPDEWDVREGKVRFLGHPARNGAACVSNSGAAAWTTAAGTVRRGSGAAEAPGIEEVKAMTPFPGAPIAEPEYGGSRPRAVDGGIRGESTRVGAQPLGTR